MELDREDPREPYLCDDDPCDICPDCGLLLDVCDCPSSAADEADFYANDVSEQEESDD